MKNKIIVEKILKYISKVIEYTKDTDYAALLSTV